MKKQIFIILSVILFSLSSFVSQGQQVSTKKERNLITAGNKLYDDGNYKEAAKKYEAALKENPSSAVGQYNLGLSRIRIGSNPADTSANAKQILQSGCELMQKVARMGNEKPNLAAQANYNLGNVSFNEEDYQKALQYYKQALRLNPDDNNARRNLRITQLKIQDQQDQNQDNQDQDQDKDQDQQNENNQDQNQDQQDQNQDQQNQNQDQKNEDQQQDQNQQISPQTAEQILNAMENKENQTRARVANEQGEKSRTKNKNRYNW